ncbi:hypothetical protein DAPPUDRAFT_119063 [Daphnia pulex]|uniref:Tf2-1-like SH3-like domain-containing protein n=1 Tax=Daphnia pulex TaxID=6669 RepID=E9HXB8_DAPPU|nr:hypothetical protein DAPPUDRAFT_119063 [Daphnia pulex]|eukprot:EFX63612.1 hypothetical protein DAPPUDRAFT_119063 [Daphnia pulex]
MFEGKLGESGRHWVRILNQVGDAQGWTNAQKRQVVVRRLGGIALQWHLQSGANNPNWQNWSTALGTNFTDRLSPSEWYKLIEERVQKAGEPGIAYAVEKSRLLDLSPHVLTNAQKVSYLIVWSDRTHQEKLSSWRGKRPGPVGWPRPALTGKHIDESSQPTQLPVIRVFIQGVGETDALLDTGSSITTVRLPVVRRIVKNKSTRILPGIRGIDNKVVKVVDEIPLQICFKDTKVSLENVAVVEMAPFPWILGIDWLVKANINLVCKDNQIVPVFIKDVEQEADIAKTDASIPEEEKRSLPSEEFFQELARDLPAVRRKGSVRFRIRKAVEVPGESLRMLKGSIPINFTGTGIVRFGFSAEPSKTWVVPSALVSFKNGKAKVPLLNLESKSVILKRRNCVIFIDLDLDAQIAVIPTEQKKKSNDRAARPARMSCAAVGGYLRAAIRGDVNTGPNLSQAEKDKVLELLDQHRRCLPSEETQLGRAVGIQHNIDTGNSRPITSRPYRISQFERRIISEKVNEMLKSGCPRRRFIKRVEQMRKTARFNIIRRQDRTKLLCDARRKASKPFHQGDLVLVRRMLKKKGLTKKFLPKYIGPFQIVKKVAETTYRVEELPSRRKKKVVRRFNAHVVQLKPFRARSDEWHVSEIDEPTGSENDSENRSEAEVTQLAVVPVMEEIPAQQLLVSEFPNRPPCLLAQVKCCWCLLKCIVYCVCESCKSRRPGKAECSGDIPDTPLALRQARFPADRCHDCDPPPPSSYCVTPLSSRLSGSSCKAVHVSPRRLRLCHVDAVLGSVMLKRYEVHLISPVIILHSCLIHARDDSVLLEQTFVGVIPQQLIVTICLGIVNVIYIC